MKFCLLHISDLHIKSLDDNVLDLSKDITKNSYSYIRECDYCFILITGDISYSGKEEEYLAAELFLLDIKEIIQDEGCKFVEIISVPGNHDCDIENNDAAREIIIEKIISDGNVNIESNIIDLCVKPQEQFFKFVDRTTKTKSIYHHKLWREYEYNINSELLRISAINASWMSRIPEKSGEMIFPVDEFKKYLDEPCAFRIAMIHHPINWYQQRSYHVLRNEVFGKCSILLSGHEHVDSTIDSSKSDYGSCLFFESSALQPHNNDDEAGFKIILIDNDELKEISFDILDNKVVKNSNIKNYNIPNKTNKTNKLPSFSSIFHDRLQKHGANFLHPDKEILGVDDVYIYPDLKQRSVDEEINISSEDIFKLDSDGRKVLIIGDEKAGKTVLLKQGVKIFHTRGLIPILVKGSSLKSINRANVVSFIEKLCEDQYESTDDIFTEKKKNRIIFIDNIDRIPGGLKNLNVLIDYAEKHFGGIYLTASKGFEISELLDNQAKKYLSNYEEYEIRKFGYKLRYKLIKKWCSCGDANITSAQLEEKVHNLEKLINNVIGSNLVPSIPLFLLTLLQSVDSKSQNELQNSSSAYYYQYLITQSLGFAGFKAEELDELFNYLSHLTWYMSSQKIREIEESELINFNSAFSDRFVRVNFEKRIRLLQKAKILSLSSGYYSFTFQFVKYFFIGKYLAEHINDQEANAVILKYCESLHRRESSNSILFLTHHSNSDRVIEYIRANLHKCFSESLPIDFDSDTQSLNTLIDSAAQFVINDLDIERNREKSREIKDEIHGPDDEIDESDEHDDESVEYDEILDLAAKMNSTIKNSEILGQVLKNYYGSIERKKKEELIREVFDGPLRMLRYFIEDVIQDPNLFVDEIMNHVKKEKPEFNDEYLEKKTRKLAFYLLGNICVGMVARTSQFVSSKKLNDDIKNVADDESSLSYRLIRAAIGLMQPGKVPIDELTKMAKELRGNNFAFMILQSFGFYHLYMFKTEEVDKQKLCSALKINIKDSHYTEFKGTKTRLMRN